MKKKYILPLVFAALLTLGACNTNNPSNSESKEPVVETARKILKASLNKDTVEAGSKTKVVSEVEGVTFRSSDEAVATVDKDGNVKTDEPGMAYITVSKEGYFDRVLKLFVDEYDTIACLVSLLF